MKINGKIEKIILAIVFILFFIISKNNFYATYYALLVFIISVYYFPVKIILNRKDNHFNLLVGSSFLISTTLVFSYLSLVFVVIPEKIKILLFIFLLVNCYLIYKYVQLNHENKYLHLILYFFLVAIYFH